MDRIIAQMQVRMVGFYERGNLPWDQELPPPEVIELLPQLAPARALDVGCSHVLSGEVLEQYAAQLGRLLGQGSIFLLYCRLREARVEDEGPSGFVEGEMLPVFRHYFHLAKVEYGVTHVREMVWPSAWYWWVRV